MKLYRLIKKEEFILDQQHRATYWFNPLEHVPSEIFTRRHIYLLEIDTAIVDINKRLRRVTGEYLNMGTIDTYYEYILEKYSNEDITGVYNISGVKDLDLFFNESNNVIVESRPDDGIFGYNKII